MTISYNVSDEEIAEFRKIKSRWVHHVNFDDMPKFYELGWRIDPEQKIRRGEHSAIMIWPFEGEPTLPAKEGA